MARDIMKDWPVQKFRPDKPVDYRYDEDTDTFIPDDGKPGLAFSGDGPFAYYVEIAYRENIVASGHYVAPGRKYKEWHYETRDGQARMGPSYEGRDSHPNERAGRKAMDFTCAKYRCANGRGKSLTERESVNCAWCANDFAGHKRDDANDRLSRARSDLAEAKRRKEEAEREAAAIARYIPDLEERVEESKIGVDENCEDEA